MLHVSFLYKLFSHIYMPAIQDVLHIPFKILFPENVILNACLNTRKVLQHHGASLSKQHIVLIFMSWHTNQASKHRYTHMCNAVTLVWGLLRLTSALTSFCPSCSGWSIINWPEHETVEAHCYISGLLSLFLVVLNQHYTFGSLTSNIHQAHNSSLIIYMHTYSKWCDDNS